MSYLLPLSTIILILCSLILTVMELSPLLRESAGSSLSSSELFSRQSVPGFEFKLRTFMGGFFSFPFLPFLWSALDFERQTLCKCPTFLLFHHICSRESALRQQSSFLHGHFCIPGNSHGFCQVKVFLLEQFLL